MMQSFQIDENADEKSDVVIKPKPTDGEFCPRKEK